MLTLQLVLTLVFTSVTNSWTLLQPCSWGLYSSTLLHLSLGGKNQCLVWEDFIFSKFLLVIRFPYSPLWERTEVISGERQEMGGDNSKIYTWDLRLNLPHYKETRLRQTQLTALACPGKAYSQYWQFPFQRFPFPQDCLEIYWAALCGQPEEFLMPPSQMALRLIK